MLAHRLRRWPNISQTSGRCVVFAVRPPVYQHATPTCLGCHHRATLLSPIGSDLIGKKSDAISPMDQLNICLRLCATVCQKLIQCNICPQLHVSSSNCIATPDELLSVIAHHLTCCLFNLE